MPSLRDHVKARKAQTELSPVDADTFRMALEQTYEDIKKEKWGATTPEDDEYVLVVIDQLVAHGRLTPDEYARFCLLATDVKRRLALSVGP